METHQVYENVRMYLRRTYLIDEDSMATDGGSQAGFRILRFQGIALSPRLNGGNSYAPARP